MSFYTKYRCEFYDIQKLAWKIDIQEDLGGQPSITNLTATGTPLTIEFNAESDDFNDPIKTSKAVFNVMSMTDFALTDLYSDEDFHFKVLIYYGTTLFWSGWIVTGEYSEPYTCPPYPVQITAIDGLSYLKNILYADSIDVTAGVETITYYNDRTFESQIILDILGKCFVTTFTEYVNIYESTMQQTINDSPFDQVKVDVDLFRDMYCWDVLTELLKKYNACIRQIKGVMTIYRPTELIGATVYGRTFTAFDTKTPTSFTPDQLINRSGSASNLRQFPGSSLMIKRSAKKITINQDYGYKQSWIDNWQLKGSTYNDTTGTWEYWSNVGGGSFNSINDILPGEKDGIALPSSNSVTVPPSYYVYQQFGTYALSSSDIINFQLDYLLYNFSGGTIGGGTIYIKVTDGTNYLYVVDDLTLDWQNSLTYINLTFASIAEGSSGWVNFRRSLTGIASTNPLTITLYGLQSAGSTSVMVAYKNIKFTATSDEIITKTYRTPAYKAAYYLSLGLVNKKKTKKIYEDVPEIVSKQWVLENAAKGVDLSFDYTLADVADSNIDNVIEQFQGALAVYVVTGSTGGTARVDKITKNATASNGYVTCNGMTRPINWDTNEETTIDNFISTFGAMYILTGVTPVKISATEFTFTANIPGIDFVGATSITPAIGSATTTTANSPGTPTYGLGYSENWNTRGALESVPLLEVIGGEIGLQYSRPKELIQMEIHEVSSSAVVLNPLGNIQDSLNQISAVNRKFILNRAEFDVLNRNWNADILEIIEQ